mgnify:CR=1 FL=1
MMTVMLVANQLGNSLFNKIDITLMRKFTLALLSSLAAIALYSSMVWLKHS